MGPFFLPKVGTTFTKRLLYWIRRLARPVFFFFFSCLSTYRQQRMRIKLKPKCIKATNGFFDNVLEIIYLLWVSVLLLYQHGPENRELYLNNNNTSYNFLQTKFILPISHFDILKQLNFFLMNLPPRSLAATSRVQCSVMPQSSRLASFSSGVPDSRRT